MSKKNLLLVDDYKPLLEDYKNFFIRKGYTVLTADNGEEALKLIKNNSIDAMVLDKIMPGMSGLEVLKEVRKKNKDLPILILSGGLDPEDKPKGIDNSTEFETKETVGIKGYERIEEILENIIDRNHVRELNEKAIPYYEEEPTVLVADDEMIIVEDLKRTIEGEGYRVYTANDRETIFQQLAKHKIGVIILDKVFANDGTNGLETAKRIKKFYPHTEIIMFSANLTGKESIDYSDYLGCFLTKAGTTEPELLEKIDYAQYRREKGIYKKINKNET